VGAKPVNMATGLAGENLRQGGLLRRAGDIVEIPNQTVPRRMALDAANGQSADGYRWQLNW
jgi:hypothetical protein